jgi:hypothetical protein
MYSEKQLGGGRAPHARLKVLMRIAPTRGWTRTYSDEAPFSCEAETTRRDLSEELLKQPSRVRQKLLEGTSARNSSEDLLVRGGRKLWERAYFEKLFRDGKTSRMNGIPTLEHHLSDLKHDFLASTQDLVCR